MTLDENSFTLVEHDTSLKTEDFYGDENKIKEKYVKSLRLL